MRRLFRIVAFVLAIGLQSLAPAAASPFGTTTVDHLPLDGGQPRAPGLGRWMPVFASRLCGSMMPEYPAWLPSASENPTPRFVNSYGIIGESLTWPDGNSLEFGSGAGALTRKGALTRMPSVWDDLDLSVNFDDKRLLASAQSKWKAHQCGYFVQGTFARADLEHVLDTLSADDLEQILGPVYFASTDDVLMQSLTGMLWRSPDGGVTWSAVVNLRGDIDPRWFARFGDGTLETRNGDANLVRSSDGGATWLPLRARDLPFNRGDGWLTRPSIVSGVGYALATRMPGAKRAAETLALVRSDRSGLRWRQIASPPQAVTRKPWRFTPALYVLDPTHMFVEWDQGCTSSAARLWSSSDAGQAWHELASPGSGRYVLSSIGRSGSTIHTVDTCETNGDTLNSSDGGFSWHREKAARIVATIASKRVELDDVSMADATVGGAIAGYQRNLLIAVTVDGGRSWHDVTPPGFNGLIFSVSCDTKPQRCAFTGQSDSLIMWYGKP